MEALYTKCDHSVEGELSLEGQNHTPGTRGLRIPKLIQEKGVLICCAILSIGFVLFIALLSQSLINVSDMSTRINLMNAQLSQKLFNVSKEVSDTSLKIELVQAEARKELLPSQESAGGLMAKGNLTSVLEELAELKRENGRRVLEELAELKRENGRIAKDVVQVLSELYNLTDGLTAKGNLTSMLEELAELKNENWRLVLEELAELKRGNGRIVKDVIQVQEELHNLTDLFKLCLRCPHNWQHFEKNCYFFSTSLGTWISAKQSCEAEGAHLVIINNKAEQNFLAGKMINDQVAWIGLSDTATEGKWVWVDGTPMSLTFWGIGEPNDAGRQGEDCATLRFNGKWNDAACSNNDFWICEQKC